MTRTIEPFEAISNQDLATRQAPSTRSPGRAAPVAARIVLGLLSNLRDGTLRITLPDGSTRQVGSGRPIASIDIAEWSVFRSVLRNGDIGFAEGFIDGAWTTPDLAALLLLFARNRDRMEAAVYGGRWGGILYRLRHWMNANSKTGSKRNIAAHYDLGNDFYALWLDPAMTYSSALFQPTSDPVRSSARSLADGQSAKYRRVLDALPLPPGASVLEIGCGWGGFAELAARERDLQVRGISLSREQLRYAESRIEAAALSKQVGFEFRDYRDYGPSDAQYDGVVSIEMYEAVGERYWPAYFQAISDRLRPGAHAVVQGITIAERLFERYREGSDFIQQYVFPGGMLATPSRIEAEAARAGLMLVDRFAFGRDYAETLRRWHAAFVENLDPVRALGFDERFIRTWKFYLAYCEAAFDAGCCDVFQFTFMKGAAPGRSVEPCSKAN